MSALHKSLDDYLKLRRALGFKLESTEWCLRGFVDFLDAEGAKHITTELALRWARRPANGEPFTWAQRMQRIRLFAAWYRARDPGTEVPDQGLLAASVRRKPPFIFSEEQIADIVREAEKLPCRRGMRSSTFSTMFGVLAVAGLRISEAITLDRTDVDLQEGQLTIRNTKFGKTRLVPVSTSTVAALRRYAKQRDRALPVVMTPAFFVSERGWRITDWATRYNFAKVSRAVGLRGLPRAIGTGADLGCTTSGTVSRPGRWSPGTAPASMSSASCLSRDRIGRRRRRPGGGPRRMRRVLCPDLHRGTARVPRRRLPSRRGARHRGGGALPHATSASTRARSLRLPHGCDAASVRRGARAHARARSHWPALRS